LRGKEISRRKQTVWENEGWEWVECVMVGVDEYVDVTVEDSSGIERWTENLETGVECRDFWEILEGAEGREETGGENKS
jgi:hypothetical protein